MFAYDNAGDVTQISLVRSKPNTSPYNNETFVYQWDELGRLSQATRSSVTHGIVTVTHVLASYLPTPTIRAERVFSTASVQSRRPHPRQLHGPEIFPTLRLDGASLNGSTSLYEDDETTEGVYLSAGSGGTIARLA